MQRESSREETKKPYKGGKGARTIEYNKMQKWVCFKSLAYTYTRIPMQQSLKKPINPFVRAWKWHIIVACLGIYFFNFRKYTSKNIKCHNYLLYENYNLIRFTITLSLFKNSIYNYYRGYFNTQY
jgi:hypothetical protein